MSRIRATPLGEFMSCHHPCRWRRTVRPFGLVAESVWRPPPYPAPQGGRKYLADAADPADHHGPEDEPQRGAPEDEAKTEIMPTRDAEQLVTRLVQEMEEAGEDRGREHLRQRERYVPERHVAPGRLLAIGQHVAGERQVDRVVGPVAD